jgi:acetylornithine deacetylase/succinyl-diaminopimelate desuccinylase-like protein
VLVYGHYDVQPADPFPAWSTPPFEPIIRGGHLYGRGSSDDKGQLFAQVKAFEAYLKTVGEPPVNLTCLFDGEEEIGSPSLERLLSRYRRELAADVAVMSDTRMLGRDRPAITFSLRGSLGLELKVLGPASELHSGNFGGAVHNPSQALCEIVARLHDERGRVAVPGFYDDVRPLSPAERRRMREVGPSSAQIIRDAGVCGPWGELGYTLYERTTTRPALIVNGIQSGYQGPGGKSVIPGDASAKLQVRLAPDQDPQRVKHLLSRRIAALTPPTLRSVLRSSPGTGAVVVDRRHPAMAAAVRAYERGFKVQPVFIRSGGTIPVVRLLQDLFGIPTVMMGFALPTSRIHAPNENLHLPTFFRGISTCVWFLHEIARMQFVGDHPRQTFPRRHAHMG